MEVESTQLLLDQAALGKEEAFQQLFALHQHYLRRLITLRMDRRLNRRFDPSDVLQETQFEAYRRLKDYCRRKPMSFRLWLRQTMCERLTMLHRQHLGSHKRAITRETPLLDGSQDSPYLRAPGSTVSEHLAKKERAEQLRVLIQQLPEADQEILTMRNLEGLSNNEVAELLQITVTTASQRYGRALLRLREVMLARGLLESQL